MLTLRLLPSLAVCLPFFIALPPSGDAAAAERKAYRYVDDRGNVIYSQTPPPDGRRAEKIDISPAHAGRGGYAGREPFVDPDAYSRYDRRQELLDERERLRQEALARREEERRRHLAHLRAECERNRGINCESVNPTPRRPVYRDRRPAQPEIRY